MLKSNDETLVKKKKQTHNVPKETCKRNDRLSTPVHVIKSLQFLKSPQYL